MYNIANTHTQTSLNLRRIRRSRYFRKKKAKQKMKNKLGDSDYLHTSYLSIGYKFTNYQTHKHISTHTNYGYLLEYKYMCVYLQTALPTLVS